MSDNTPDNLLEIDFGKQSIPAEVLALIREIIPDLPDSAMRGIQIASNLLFTSDMDENRAAVKDISNILEIADISAEEIYAYHYGQMPDDVITVLAGGSFLLETPGYQELLSDTARDIVQETKALIDNPALLNNDNTSIHARFITLVHYHEYAKQSYESLLAGDIEDYEHDRQNGSLLSLKKIIYPHASELEYAICDYIDKAELLWKNRETAVGLVLDITQAEAEEDLTFAKLAAVSGLSDQDAVAKAIELAALCYTNQEIRTAEAAEDSADGKPEFYHQPVRKTLTDCGIKDLSDLANVYTLVIDPVRKLKSYYPRLGSHMQAAMILYPDLVTHQPPDYIDEDLAEIVADDLGDIGQKIIYMFRAFEEPEKFEPPSKEETCYLHDCRAAGMMQEILRQTLLLLDRDREDALLEFNTRILKEMVSQAEELMSEKKVHHPELHEDLDTTCRGALAAIRNKENDMAPRALPAPDQTPVRSTPLKMSIQMRKANVSMDAEILTRTMRMHFDRQARNTEPCRMQQSTAYMNDNPAPV